MKSKYLNYFAVVFLVFLVSVSHWQWVLTTAILTYSDWGFYFKDSFFDKSLLPFGWDMNGYGSANVQASFYPVILLFTIIFKIGFPFEIAERLLFLFPILLFSSIGSYLFLKKIINSVPGAILGSIIFCFNTYTLTLQFAHLSILLAGCMIPLCFLLYIKSLQERKITGSLITTFILFIISFVDFRIFYITVFIFVFYIFFYLYHEIKTLREKILICIWGIIPVIIVLLLNIYWVVGLSSIGAVTSNEIFNRNLFGGQFLNITRAITLFHPFWTGGEISIFEIQKIPYYFYLIPILALVGLFLGKRNWVILYFGFLSLLGIFLTKQEAEPFSHIYLWLYKHFPGFNAFREASKFYILIVLSYSVLIGYFIKYIWEKPSINKNIKYTILILTASLFLFNAKPLITGEFGSLFIPRHVPEDYNILKEYVKDKKIESRSLWIPSTSRWSYNDNSHRIINASGLTTNQLKHLINDPDKKSFQELIVSPYFQSFSRNIISKSSIKYFIIPTEDNENDNNFFMYFGGETDPQIRKWYIDQIDKISWLKKIDIGTKELVIYENTNYHPHIDSITSLVRLDSFKNLEDKYSFILDRYKRDTDFYVNTSSSTVPSDHLSLLYEEADVSTIYYDNVNKWLKESHQTNSDTKLYINNSPATTYFLPDIDSYKIVRSYVTGLQVDGQPLWKPDTETVYSSSRTLWPAYLQVGTQIVQTNKNSSAVMMLGSADLPIELLLKIDDSVIPNGAFESGLWEEKVGDCNNYDDNGQLAQRLVRDNRDNGMSLELEATRHTACTGKKSISITEGDEYILSLDYQSDNAKVAGYYISMVGATTTIISERLPIVSADWSTYQKRIVIPEKVKNISFTLYAFDEDGTIPIKVRYDNIRLEKVLSIKKIDPSKKVTFRPVDKTLRGTTTFMMSDPNIRLNNLIPNPNFYKELWTKSVGDCNNYDDDGQLAQYHVDDTRDGGKSLELEATRHTACTGPGLIPVVEGATYLLSFDYQSLSGQPAGYYIGWSGTTTQAISEQIPVRDTAWHTFTRHVTIPYGATGVSLSVYAYEKDGTTPVKVRYDNFYLTKLPEIENRYYLLNDKRLDLEKPKSITFDLVNPTKKLVHIRSAATPFYLTMSESYHPQWQAQLNNSKVVGTFNSWIPWVTPDAVQSDHHFKLDGFLNGWYIDPDELCLDQSKKLRDGCKINLDGSYDIEMIIEFTPQRYFYIGLLISGTTLLSCILYLLYDVVKRRRDTKKVSKRY